VSIAMQDMRSKLGEITRFTAIVVLGTCPSPVLQTSEVNKRQIY